MLVLSAAPAAHSMSGGNLVVNGDAETPIGAEWTSATGPGLGPLDRRVYGVGDTSPPLYLTGGTFDGGVAHLWGTDAATVATQSIALGVADAAAIDTGTVRARLTGDVGALQQQTDDLEVTAHWADAEGAVVLTQRLAPTSVAERGGLTGFLRRSAEAPVPVGARSVVLTLTGRRDVGTTQDGYLDNLVLRLIGVPQVRLSFGAKEAVPAGVATPLELAIENSEDLEAKGPWSLRHVLPEGLRVASTVETSTTCPGGRVSADGRTVEAAGALSAGSGGCVVRVPVVADAPGVFRTGAADVVATGMRAPARGAALVVRERTGTDAGPPAAPGLPDAVLPPAVERLPALPGAPTVARTLTVVRPRADALLRVAVTTTRPRVRRRSTVRVRATVRNRSTRPLTDVDVCLRLPSGLTYVPRPATGVRIDGRRCWTARRIEAGGSRAFGLTARAGRRARLVVVRGRADAAEALGTTTADRRVRVVR